MCLPYRPVFSFALLVLVACGGGGTQIVTPPPPPPSSFSVALTPDPEDAAPAQALGWATGIPDADVTITPKDSSAAPRSAKTNAQGVADFGTIPSGDYVVDASRWLNATETAQLPSTEDVTGWVAKNLVHAAAGGGTATVVTPANRRKGLMISEWAFNQKGDYYDSGFLELYNNGDSTVYLDGLIVGEGWPVSVDLPTFPCAASAPYRDDSQGIWSRFFQQFPGRGRDYPVAPGHTIVIATDAIDHRALIPGGLDLRAADFEFTGYADVDNPAVPNMVDIGLINYDHGSKFAGLVSVPFIAFPVDVASLARARSLAGQYVRFPADRIVDAFAIGSNYPPPAGSAECPPLVNHRFDRQASHVRGLDDVVEFDYSVSRRHANIIGSRITLQWTRTGAADLIRTARNPGVP